MVSHLSRLSEIAGWTNPDPLALFDPSSHGRKHIRLGCGTNPKRAPATCDIHGGIRVCTTSNVSGRSTDDIWRAVAVGFYVGIDFWRVCPRCFDWQNFG